MGQKFNLPYLSAGGRAGELNQLVGRTGGSGVLFDARHAMAGNIWATEAGSGITSAGELYKSGVSHSGGIYHSTILIDLTGLNSSAAGDIIGADGAANCHIGMWDAATNGTCVGGRINCLEAPADGEPDIDLYMATEATGAEDSAISALAETALLATGADWTIDLERSLTALPTDGKYLYLVGSGAGTDDTYTAGKFLIEFWGY